jgi:DUF1009 family protein
MIADVQNPAGAILFKAPKSGQSRLIDLPTVGPQTVQAAQVAGMRGVVIEAGGVLVLDLQKTIGIADAHGLVFWAYSPK